VPSETLPGPNASKLTVPLPSVHTMPACVGSPPGAIVTVDRVGNGPWMDDLGAVARDARDVQQPVLEVLEAKDPPARSKGLLARLR
jgi:hypothetical protein